ncbi:conserved hypothetical protein [Tenacibaculum sediminilitoris]|uniref:hypothetical protein n=1 Tax=Tenacibaculum sediminilitoris TaxID=1820334 RepID=UPI0038961BD5
MKDFQKSIIFLGFIEGFNKKLFQQISFSDVLKKRIPEKRQKIIDYLEKGEIVVAWMGYFVDNKGNLISPDCYYTDGNYIWPSYLISFMKDDCNYCINEGFIDYLEDLDYNFPRVDNFKLEYIKNNLSKVLVSTPPER